MIAGARYGHTNLIAEDWQALSRFYQELFGCVPVPPVRDFKGPNLEPGTGIPASILHSCLEAAGLPVSVLDADLVQTHSLLSIAVGGVRVVVPEHFVEEAREIMEALA